MKKYSCYVLAFGLFFGASAFSGAAALKPAAAPEPAAVAQPPAAFAAAPLPYAEDALAPSMSAETLQFHYGKHYKGYVAALNRLTAGRPEAKMSLEQVIMTAQPGPVFNNAAQAWNHVFFFNCLRPGGGGRPVGALAAAIERDFGSYEAFRAAFTQAAQGLFGSGWAWLVADNGKLKIEQYANADLPMKHGQWGLLVLDVWEHAYYIDRRNARADYIEAAMNSLVNWDFAAANYASAPQGK